MYAKANGSNSCDLQKTAQILKRSSIEDVTYTSPVLPKYTQKMQQAEIVDTWKQQNKIVFMRRDYPALTLEVSFLSP